MKNTYIAIGIVVVLVVAFLIISKKKVEAPIETPENSVVETTVENPTNGAPTNPSSQPKPTEEKTYSYTNSEFDFAVKLPGLVATQKTETPLSLYAIFTFGVGDQSAIEEQKRVPNTMAVYIWSNESDFNKMTESGTALADETINGTTFKVFSFTNEDATSYHYTAEKDGLIYDIGVRNKSDAAKFYFI